jgi:hypothetical protein
MNEKLTWRKKNIFNNGKELNNLNNLKQRLYSLTVETEDYTSKNILFL